MFGGFAPPQLPEEEIQQLEGEANWTVKQFIATAVANLVIYRQAPIGITMASIHNNGKIPKPVGPERLERRGSCNFLMTNATQGCTSTVVARNRYTFHDPTLRPSK
ncbi:hypothetical protein CIB48_g5263 [Xylaria polymorpha]|nr:hypothetical protein CIB48_g5263 [Xylaria polymorpha]